VKPPKEEAGDEREPWAAEGVEVSSIWGASIEVA